VATIEGVFRRFDLASDVFGRMKSVLQSGKKPLKTDDLLWFKKRVRGDTLSLIINRQLRFLGNQLIKGTSRYLGDCVITCPDSALILAGYQNSNKSCNKTERIREKTLETLKIGEPPVDMETLFSRTKVAFDYLVLQKGIHKKTTTGEKITLKLNAAMSWWRDPILCHSLKQCAFLNSAAK
jgi:hypothetical protein